jgi:hypothetical protein
MSIDAGPVGSPNQDRPSTEQNGSEDISPGLREHIREAAAKIRSDHAAELADVLKADGAVRLFRSLVHPNGFEEPSVTPGEVAGSIAAELGSLFGDAVRTGTGLLAVPLTALAHEWIATVENASARLSRGVSSAEVPAPGEKTEKGLSAEPRVLGMTVDTTPSGRDVPGIPTASPEEVRLLGLFRRFMPMLMITLRQGGTGNALAEKVITLFGRPTYDQACGIGKDRIMTILQLEPDLWAQVAPVEASFSRFLEEFLRYGAYVDKSAAANREAIRAAVRTNDT